VAHALTIGQLAKATGVGAKTIRFYEQIGVLPTSNRTAAGYRQYDQSGVQRLRFIRRARSLGLPLRDVKTGDHAWPCVLACWRWSGDSSLRYSTGPQSSDCSSGSLNTCCTAC